jgi:hypothetical protein
MAANTGRSNAKWIQVFLDTPSSLTELTAYIKSVNTIGVTSETQDVTAYSDAVKNVTIGRADAPIAIKFNFDTALYAHLLAIKAAPTTPLSLNIEFGVNHAWYTGEPTFGITSSTTSGYLMTGMSLDWDNQEINCDFAVYGPTAPSFGTTAFT